MGTGADTWVRFGAGLEVWADCGHAYGAWRAAGAMLLTSLFGASGGPECLGDLTPEGAADSVRWLVSATSYEVRTDAIDLLDRTGEVVATLVADGTGPPPDPHALDQGAPQLTPELAAYVGVPAPLPSAASPVDDLVGRWLPTDRTEASKAADLEFDANGVWSASDGCNGSSGRWVAGPDGLLLTTLGGMTLMGCENSSVIQWIGATARAGLVGEDLVLFDQDGNELGTLLKD